MTRRPPLLYLASLAALCGVAGAQQITARSIAGRPGAAATIALAPITGTPDTLQPGVTVANLDAGNLVAGRTWWRFEGIFFIETYVGFLWMPSGGATPFEIPGSLYFNQNVQSPNDVADDGTVVGTDTFTTSLTSLPFRWTPAGGFQLLETPGGGWVGGAAAVSADGALIAGTLQPGLFGTPRAVRWVYGALDVFGSAGERSGAWDTSDDGTLIVGEIGPDAGNLRATRWLDGIELGLDPVLGETSSTARFVSDDGRIAFGTATVGGRDVLVRWRPDGSARAFPPPGGLSVESVNAIDARGRAAVGSLTDGGPFFQADWVPFLWTAGGGYALIGELGRPQDYDKSRAVDVSDDGRRVVGQLSSSVVSNGDPPTIAFLWTPRAGTQDLQVLLKEAGGPPLGLFDTVAISGDGQRILATGVVRPTLNDTSSVLMEFDLGPPLK